ncbi:TetR/AcrR family transcriptional regulator [Deinococcus koreensis]|uniref:TetR/AcrR family transcriptional regulator n=1 Tax=Deinococcus koreensis TaxID=2054903 RepID=A0A2K3UUR3_9DEIO|nr:TetR/AcrR family transcriptional regulator [Deinococcus koreensis]PNY80276.1 TetR/AcrR family transcriptional regulator [Deinococcus koreensis]
MARTRDPEQTQARLLQAAAEAVLELGPTFSLDAVARAAGVSKGGLLHHFPSREALVTALTRDLLRRFTARVSAIHGSGEPQPGAWLRAYIEVSFQEDAQERALILALSPLLNATQVMEQLAPELAEPVQAARTDGVPGGRAQAVRLACDGYWSGQLVLATRLDAAESAALKEELLSWTR